MEEDKDLISRWAEWQAGKANRAERMVLRALFIAAWLFSLWVLFKDFA
jgi:hypothetical protein